MLTTTRRGVSYPNPDRSDRADIAAHFGLLAAALDVDVIFNQGTDAARVAAAHQSGGGRFWWSTDTLTMWYDDGTTWQSLGSLLAFSTQTANYVVTANDAGKVVEMNVASGNTLTIPNDTTLVVPVGTQYTIVQYGAGQTTIVAGSGNTIRAYNGNLKLAGQYAMASAIKRATNEWYVAGNLVP